MSHLRHWCAISLLMLLSIPTIARAQVAADSREKSEKVSEILAALQAERGKRIADVGAGEGFYSLRIARAVGPTGRITAVDVSEKYLEKLRARLQQDNVTNVDVVVGAVDDPRLLENTFDSGLIYNAYHEMTAPEPVPKAIFKALKPSGRLVMSEPLHNNVRSATRAEQMKEHEPTQGTWINDPTTARRTGVSGPSKRDSARHRRRAGHPQPRAARRRIQSRGCR